MNREDAIQDADGIMTFEVNFVLAEPFIVCSFFNDEGEKESKMENSIEQVQLNGNLTILANVR